eukprot:TRINITY_DN726_c1_g1_i1.p1 TRINITY_DN726_c1_g1~~TRINITY_DN726_c1_g1_i1.p1  ORF type:complete len:213 (+),score=58.64 TRINITY_DN726_c1_g1_i1:119-757(+)
MNFYKVFIFSILLIIFFNGNINCSRVEVEVEEKVGAPTPSFPTNYYSDFTNATYNQGKTTSYSGKVFYDCLNQRQRANTRKSGSSWTTVDLHLYYLKIQQELSYYNGLFWSCWNFTNVNEMDCTILPPVQYSNYIGQKKVSDQTCDGWVYNLPNGNVVYYYSNANTHLPVSLEYVSQFTTTYSNFVASTPDADVFQIPVEVSCRNDGPYINY